MLDLAENHKQGLVVNNTVLLAGGILGLGDMVPKGLETRSLGAIVIGPLTRHSRAGAAMPRLTEGNGGFVLNTDLQNRGISSTLKKFSKVWSRLGCPVILQLADSHRDALEESAARAASCQAVVGLELLLSSQTTTHQAATLVEMAAYSSDLPLWVKLPLATAVELAPLVVDAGASSVVIGQAVRGMLGSTKMEESWFDLDTASAEIANLVPIQGDMQGPLLFGLMLDTLQRVAALNLPCELIACGGIHTTEQAVQALTFGAQAVQLDSAIWVEPGLPMQIIQELDRS